MDAIQALCSIHRGQKTPLISVVHLVIALAFLAVNVSGGVKRQSTDIGAFFFMDL